MKRGIGMAFCVTVAIVLAPWWGSAEYRAWSSPLANPSRRRYGGRGRALLASRREGEYAGDRRLR